MLILTLMLNAEKLQRFADPGLVLVTLVLWEYHYNYAFSMKLYFLFVSSNIYHMYLLFAKNHMSKVDIFFCGLSSMTRSVYLGVNGI